MLRHQIHQDRALAVQQHREEDREHIYVKYNPLYVSTHLCIERCKELLNLNEKATDERLQAPKEHSNTTA